MSGCDAPLKMCGEDLLVKVDWEIPGAAAGGKKQFCLTLIVVVCFFFFFDSQKSVLELWVQRNSARNQKSHIKPQKLMFSPLLKYSSDVKRNWRQLLMGRLGGEAGSAQVIGQIRGYRAGPRKSHLLCVILFLTEMSDLLLNRVLLFRLQPGSA